MNRLKHLLAILVFTFSALSMSTAFALLEDEKNTIETFKNSVQSVVNVTNLQMTKGSIFDYDAHEVPVGAGTGFVWDKEGHIITNFHVIAGGDKFLVTFRGDKKQYPASLVGKVSNKDVAVLKLEEKPKNLQPIKVGKSKTLQVGQKTMAIGNPFGLDHTITSGIVSALDRKIMGIGNVRIYGMIQTDASINPGNSGGPLLDSNGALIGMNTVIYSKSGSSAGIGFAVPVDTISLIIPDLIKNGKVTRPGLGIGPASEYQKTRLGVDKGIVVLYVDPEGGAGKAGIVGFTKDKYGRTYPGDIILAIDKKEVDNIDDIYHILGQYKVGDIVTADVFRKGKIKKIKIELIPINDN
ncbi:S1C family serine protease [Halobacteriovorax sp. HLS]|uniref:S1C family serine protease n=1 Tax=Halobacteriovorax sp. HLS TaxID=2234000 RepID=UPI000FD8C578|nr:trypsin-like peptidase domain-containing protein [Halobacteriovorax sp. HLS]